MKELKSNNEELALLKLTGTINNMLQDYCVGEYGRVPSPLKELLFGTEFKNVYYEDHVLVLNTNKNIDLYLDIRTETFSVKSDNSITKRLMPINMLRLAFMFYGDIKGKNEFYRECYSNSCIRHLYTLDLEKPFIDVKKNIFMPVMAN